MSLSKPSLMVFSVASANCCTTFGPLTPMNPSSPAIILSKTSRRMIRWVARMCPRSKKRLRAWRTCARALPSWTKKAPITAAASSMVLTTALTTLVTPPTTYSIPT